MPLRILQEKDFFGRIEELQNLYLISLEADKDIAQSIFLSGPRGIGKTELLKQLFNNIFWGQDRIAPVYYSINSAMLSVQDFSRDYLTRYLCQRLAFEKKESSLTWLDGLSIEGLTSILEDKKAFWALEILDSYVKCRDPIDSLRIALSAPHLSTLATGQAAVVMIDEFQQLRNLHIGGRAEPMLISLFEKPLSSRKVLHFITGNQPEIQEIPLTGGLAKIDVKPLGLEDDTLMFSSILAAYGVNISLMPYALLNHLGGNPFYIKCVAKAAGSNKKVEEEDCWRAYIREINSGGICLYWTVLLKSFFPEMEMRRNVLEIINKIYHGGESFSQESILKMLSSRKEYTETIAKALYLSGLVNGEFGILRTPGDTVLIDFMDCLYAREVLRKSYKDIERDLLERASGAKGRDVSYEMTIPMVKEAELVAAQCLEQIGKNLHLNEELIGQLQMALIEACINAIEHSKGEDNKIYLSFSFSGDRLVVSIESSGREFISKETGEPFIGRALKEDSGRGWGIKLIKRFTDSVGFEKTERGTKVVLVKNLSRKPTIDNKDKKAYE